MSNGKLTVSGTGRMGYTIPWTAHAGQIKNVVLEPGVENISGSAFADCASLVNVSIPDTVTAIEGSAFSNCRSLTGITIPKSVTSIGCWSFSFFKNVSYLYCYADELRTTGSYLFDDSVLKNSTLHVPASALEA